MKEQNQQQVICHCAHCKCNRAFVYDSISFDGHERHRCLACGHLYSVTGEGNAPRSRWDLNTLDGQFLQAHDEMIQAQKSYDNSGLGQREACHEVLVKAEKKFLELKSKIAVTA